MNLQLIATIVIIILYPIGFVIAKKTIRGGGEGRFLDYIGVTVLILFIACSIYLLISSWLSLLMIIGGGMLILFGTSGFSVILEARRSRPHLRSRGLVIFIDFIAVGGGVYLLFLSIIRSLG